MISPRRMRPVCRRILQQAIAWAVFPKPHVVGEQQATRGQEAIDAFALIGIERALEPFDRVANLASADARVRRSA